MWFEQELAKYQNDTRAALSLFLPFPDGMNALDFDRAARAGHLTGIARLWENHLLTSCRLLASSVSSGSFSDTMRYARSLARLADGKSGDALARLDVTTPEIFAHQMREDRARRALRRAFNMPSASTLLSRQNGTGTGTQRSRSPAKP